MRQDVRTLNKSEVIIQQSLVDEFIIIRFYGKLIQGEAV
jgi:hypothetical protein